MELPIIEHKNKIIRIILSSIVLVAYLLFLLNNRFDGNVLTFFFIFILLIKLIFSLDKLNIREIGKIKINEKDFSIINNNSTEKIIFNFKDFSKIFITKKTPLDLFYAGSLKIFLTITLQNTDKEITYNVLLKKSKMRKEFINKLKELYKNNLNIKEFGSDGNRAFLLKSKLSYEEIQEIKKEYNLSWN